MVQHDVSAGKYYVDGVEVSEQEYNDALSEILQKNALADDIFAGAKTIDDCPVEWREEVELMVDIRQESADSDIDDSELLDILMGVSE